MFLIQGPETPWLNGNVEDFFIALHRKDMRITGSLSDLARIYFNHAALNPDEGI